MESHHQGSQSDKTPSKTLETTAAADATPDPSPSVAPPQQQQPAEDAGGEDPRDAKPPSSEISDLEKKQRRAERFGVPVQLSEEDKRSSRAERFGTGTGSGSSRKSDDSKGEKDKRKARAERFGLAGQASNDDEAKKKARSERFGMNPVKITPEEEEKRKARALRFSGPSSVGSETNGKDSPEQKAADEETKEEA